jgi:hypothetical protein
MITSSYEGPATWQIIDMNGRVLSTIQSRITKGMQQFKWNTSSWPAGIYLIRIQTQKEQKVQKVYVPRN